MSILRYLLSVESQLSGKLVFCIWARFFRQTVVLKLSSTDGSEQHTAVNFLAEAVWTQSHRLEEDLQIDPELFHRVLPSMLRLAGLRRQQSRVRSACLNVTARDRLGRRPDAVRLPGEGGDSNP